jgi:predicted alpha/beta superfamily hydrolase
LEFSYFVLLILAFTIAGVGIANGKPRRKHSLTGKFRFHKNFHSQFLPSDRDVIIYLPPGYDRAKKKRYPVLYMHDGQNLFDGATSFIPGKEWRVDETAQSLIRNREIEPLIIVGIYNTGLSRVDEYTPTRDQKRNMGGKADLYGRLLVEELKPFIDSEYRTLTDAANTGLGGSSLGGLATLYLGLKYSDTFGKLAIISPSLWWDNRFILRGVEAMNIKHDVRIWLDMGTNEGTPVNDARQLRDAFESKGWQMNSDLKYFEAEGAVHDEAAWGNRVGMVLRFLFPKRDR